MSSDTARGTERIAGDEVRALSRDLQPEQQLILLLIHRGGMLVHPLDVDTPVILGRQPPASLCINDSTLSQRHARITLDVVGPRVLVEDLGSTNGLWRKGKRVKSASLAAGEHVMAGGVMLRARAIHTSAPPPKAGSGGQQEDMVAGAAMQKLLKTARRVARSQVPVILHGETGTGKEVLARFLHRHSPRADKPMLSVNCGAISAGLIESTLFGHERGAFTGAQQQRKGVFESADGGTVFLDEIGELPAAAQAALLRVLETGSFNRVGATLEQKVDVRVIAATHRDLASMVKQGAFREDLYFRLNTLILTIPPLRERKDDIEPLALRFLQRANHIHERNIRSIDPHVLSRFAQYDFPGNVRELRNLIERAVVIADEDHIGLVDLPEHLANLSNSPAHSSTVQGSPTQGSTAPAEPSPHAAAPSPHAESPPPEPAAHPSEEPAAPARGLRSRMQEYEAQLILEALHKARWDRKKAAQALQMPLRTLAHKIKALGLSKGSD